MPLCGSGGSRITLPCSRCSASMYSGGNRWAWKSIIIGSSLVDLVSEHAPEVAAARRLPPRDLGTEALLVALDDLLHEPFGFERAEQCERIIGGDEEVGRDRVEVDFALAQH